MRRADARRGADGVDGTDLDAEDSLALDRGPTGRRVGRRVVDALDVAVVRFPRIVQLRRPRPAAPRARAWRCAGCGRRRPGPARPRRAARVEGDPGRPRLVPRHGAGRRGRAQRRAGRGRLRRAPDGRRPHRRPTTASRARRASVDGPRLAAGDAPTFDGDKVLDRPAGAAVDGPRRRSRSPATASTTAGCSRGRRRAVARRRRRRAALGWWRGRVLGDDAARRCSRPTGSAPAVLRVGRRAGGEAGAARGELDFAAARQARLDRIADTLEAHLDLDRLVAPHRARAATVIEPAADLRAALGRLTALVAAPALAGRCRRASRGGDDAGVRRPRRRPRRARRGGASPARRAGQRRPAGARRRCGGRPTPTGWPARRWPLGAVGRRARRAAPGDGVGVARSRPSSVAYLVTRGPEALTRARPLSRQCRSGAARHRLESPVAAAIASPPPWPPPTTATSKPSSTGCSPGTSIAVAGSLRARHALGRSLLWGNVAAACASAAGSVRTAAGAAVARPPRNVPGRRPPRPGRPRPVDVPHRHRPHLPAHDLLPVVEDLGRRGRPLRGLLACPLPDRDLSRVILFVTNVDTELLALRARRRAAARRLPRRAGRRPGRGSTRAPDLDGVTRVVVRLLGGRTRVGARRSTSCARRA